MFPFFRASSGTTRETVLESINHVHEIEIEAEIKLGEILKDMDKNKGAANAVDMINRVPPTLAEIGVSIELSSEAQALADLPEAASGCYSDRDFSGDIEACLH